MPLTDFEKQWIDAHVQEATALLKELGRIPAPSHREERRAQFVKNWLTAQGAQEVYIDEASNAILKIGVTDTNPVCVVMAHTDIVFDDTELLDMREEGTRLFAPGIGDDTANLVALLMAAKYALENKLAPDCGLLIAANSCEEGLGNLKGVKQILKDYDGRVRELVSIDLNLGEIVTEAVGSVRMKITIKARGGHSYSDFGNDNAIVQMAGLITRLYEKTPPSEKKTTYNAGVIEGGSTINSIAGECSLLYEYRSESRECMKEMDDYLTGVLNEFRSRGVNIDAQIIAVRPCRGNVDEDKEADLIHRASSLVFSLINRAPEIKSASTDANASLALGIPSVTIGAIIGGGAHTRGEWVDLESLPAAMAAAIGVLKWYLK